MLNAYALRLLLWYGLLWLASPTLAQDRLLRFADQLASEQRIDSARHEYRRWLFFAEDAAAAAGVWFRLGRLEEQSNRYAEARDAYLRCQLTTDNLQLRRWAVCRAGFCSLILNEFAEGHYYLQPAIDLRDSLGRYVAWLDAMCLVGMGEYAHARNLIRELYVNDCAAAIRLDSCLSRAENERMLSSSSAQWLSILPGLGLMYAKAWREGLRSIGLTGGATAFTVLAISQQFYWVGLLTGAVVAQRFYEGGARLAAREVERRNTIRQCRLRQAIQRELLRVPVAAVVEIPNVPE